MSLKQVQEQLMPQIHRLRCPRCSHPFTMDGLKTLADNSMHSQMVKEIKFGIEALGAKKFIAYHAKEVHKGESRVVDKDGYKFYTHGGTNYLVCYTY